MPTLPLPTLDLTLAARSPVPSPCLSVCRMDLANAAGDALCAGCFRTIAEIAAWSRLDEAGKRRVWALIAARAADQMPAF